MSIIVTYPDGSTETMADAVRVDTQNFHEGMFDFYDARGTLLRQIDMGSGITWVETNSDLDPREAGLLNPEDSHR